MDRELVFVILALLLVGPAFLAFGAWPEGREGIPGARRLERRDWLRIWLPLVPGSLAIAALVGWALVEPARAESVPLPLIACALPFCWPWIRAFGRAIRAYRRDTGRSTIATVGLLRPRAVIAPGLAEPLDPDSLRAARAHEEAHVRHFDPLRILLAQAASDLQWPWPSARVRFLVWRRSLEMARDEEARENGADGADLAAAILAIARSARATDAVCSLASQTEDSIALQSRIDRLLAPVQADRAGSRALHLGFLIGGLVLACVIGAAHGEEAVRAFLALFA